MNHRNLGPAGGQARADESRTLKPRDTQFTTERDIHRLLMLMPLSLRVSQNKVERYKG